VFEFTDLIANFGEGLSASGSPLKMTEDLADLPHTPLGRDYLLRVIRLSGNQVWSVAKPAVLEIEYRARFVLYAPCELKLADVPERNSSLKLSLPPQFALGGSGPPVLGMFTIGNLGHSEN
jgi:hypothetical protein